MTFSLHEKKSLLFYLLLLHHHHQWRRRGADLGEEVNHWPEIREETKWQTKKRLARDSRGFACCLQIRGLGNGTEERRTTVYSVHINFNSVAFSIEFITSNQQVFPIGRSEYGSILRRENRCMV